MNYIYIIQKLLNIRFCQFYGVYSLTIARDQISGEKTIFQQKLIDNFRKQLEPLERTIGLDLILTRLLVKFFFNQTFVLRR